MRKLLISFLSLWLTMLACATWRPYHSTPLDALTEWPGFLSGANRDSVEVLQQEEIAGGLVLLYLYRSPEPEPAAGGQYCVATTFLTQEKNGGWRAQHGSSIGCSDNFPEVDRFIAVFTPGGNITDLTTVYGLSNRGSAARIEWSDGLVSTVPLQNRTFLKSRPVTLQVRRIELLDEKGDVLDSKDENEFWQDLPGHGPAGTPGP